MTERSSPETARAIIAEQARLAAHKPNLAVGWLKRCLKPEPLTEDERYEIEQVIAAQPQNSQVRQMADHLREEHFAQAHTDMIGDEEERRGYLMGIEAMVAALSDTRPDRGGV